MPEHTIPADPHYRRNRAHVPPGTSPLALSVSPTSTDIDVTEQVAALPPDQGGTVDTIAGQPDSTATATGGDGSYTYAWTIAELSDDGSDGSSCAILSEGTKTNARYNTATFRVTIAASLAGVPPAPVMPPPFFSEAIYRLRCTVTDGNGDTATADYTVTIVNSA